MAAGGSEDQMGAEDWALNSELEVLESIYLDELQVFKGNNRSVPWEISITLHPATAEDHDSQYVCFTLVLSVPLQYPNEIPKIAIQNPRGLSDEQIQKISQTLQCIAETQLGTPVLYELIEGKEILTDNNIPHGQCVICLYGFQENEAFTKTPCYHYFHSRCLASYTEHMEKEISVQKKERIQHLTVVPKEDIEVQCPVCREPLVYDLAMLQAAPLPQQSMEVYQPDQRTLQHREQLRQIFQRQQEKGGIIDPELERNRYFVSLQKPSDVREYDHTAVSESDLGSTNELKSPAGSEHTQRSTALMNNELQNIDKSSVTLHHHNKRERSRGEKPSLQNPSWQVRCKALEMATEMYVAGESKAFSRRPNWKKERGRWNTGRYNQDISTSYSQDQESLFMDKKDLCTKSIPSAKEEKNNMGNWIPMQKTQASNREKVDICHSEFRGQSKWQGQHGTQDCERWEKTKGREYVTYPKMPRGRGQSRPKPWKELQGEENEGGS